MTHEQNEKKEKIEKIEKTEKKPGKKRLRGVFFPRDYDFLGMLSEQAAQTLVGVENLVEWLNTPEPSEPESLARLEQEVDEKRHEFEDLLTNAFSTPFDRQDMYSLSRRIDYILNYSHETAAEMFAFRVSPDRPIHEMARALLKGTGHLAEGVKVMQSDHRQATVEIRESRRAIEKIEAQYISGMAELLNSDDPMRAMRKREIYHHLRDGGRALRNSIDILHKIVVGLI